MYNVLPIIFLAFNYTLATYDGESLIYLYLLLNLI